MLNLKTIIKKFIPILIPIILIPEYCYDFWHYVVHSGVLKTSTKTKLIARITEEYHVIEKGLTMPETRLGFGRNNLLSLLSNCNEFVSKYGFYDIQLRHAASVVNEYLKFHEDNAYKLDKTLVEKIDIFRQKTHIREVSKQIQSTQKEYFKHNRSSFDIFSSSRKSLRNYSDKEVPIETINAAVDLSRNTPSSCNRQGSRVYIYSDRALVKQILKLQGGNRGFGHLAKKLIVVTAELGISHGVFERHQVWIDGGMFAMNLLYSLHFMKIAACPLNCNFSIKKDRELRKLCGIKNSEVFIMMISCGIPPDSFQIALSKRYPLEHFLHIY
ncbi:nitroreductase family protein [Saccharicrinis sp. FJH54]|uniref:nitroreductase family protein n=1 Tax=Saccharicrinis sp. FJH54 TaxID=3344665 RepID=UPI0035D449D0